MSDSLWPHGLQPARLLCPRSSPSKNTAVWVAISYSIFLTQGSNPHFLHLLPWQADSLPLLCLGVAATVCCWFDLLDLPGAVGLLLLPLHASWGRWRGFSRMDPTWYFFLRKRTSGLWRWGALPRLGTWGQTMLLGNGEHSPGGAQVVAGCALLRPPAALSDGGHS